MSWPLVKLSDVATIERNSIDASQISSGTKYIGLEHIESGGCILGFQNVINGGLASTKFRFGTNHVLYGKLRPYLAKIALPEFEGICSTDILPINPNYNVNKKFLAYFLRQPSMVDFAASRAIGINLPRLSPKTLEEFQIPLPPLEEQKRIAAILDQADALRRLRQRAIDRLNTLGQAIFYEMFGDPATNPKSWPIVTIKELTASTQYGTSSKAGDVGNFPILRMGNINESGAFDYSSLKYIDLSALDIEKYTVRDGDILFNRTNSPDLVGKTGVYRGNSIYAFAGYLVRLRVNEKAVSEYVGIYLNSPFGKKILRNMCKTIIGMANINAKELLTIPIPLVPIHYQREFQEKLFAINLTLPFFEKYSQEIDKLFSSLQYRAFRGEL